MDTTTNQKELRAINIPVEAENVHIEIYYTVPHAAIPEKPAQLAPDGVTVIGSLIPAKPAWGEPFRHHLVNLTVEQAKALIAAMDTALG